jgi:hypothetical protein
MASLVLAGDTSGSITVSAPAVAGSTTQTLVNVTGTLAPVVSGTAVASTSGTSIDFTGIPSWVKRITVMFSGVSTNGTSVPQIQIGAGSFTTSGYVGTASSILSTVGSANYSSGALLVNAAAATQISYGAVRITNISGNNWVFDGVLGRSDTGATTVTGGALSLSGTLDRVRITTVNGTDTFDAGNINILYE